MATIQNQADTILRATSPRLLSNPLNYISIIPTTNTVTSTSGTLTPSTVTVKAILNGSLRGTITWSTSPSITTTPITDGIVINSTNIPDGTSVLVTATLNYAGNVYTATTNITRKQAISLSSSGVLTGEGGGSITSLDYSNVSGTKPPATATSNFFSTSTSDPTGGVNGDAHFNSTTNVMWFKVAGAWTRGGTVSASEITTGTLAAARIAANSITASKLSVSSLSSVSANLGTVTAGDITSSANINITGTANFQGATNSGGVNYCGVFNEARTVSGGVSGTAGASGFGVRGSAGTSGSIGVSGTGGSSPGAEGVRATQGSGGGVALSVVGPMTISSATLVSNLNADMVDGLHASSLAKISGGNSFSGSQYITGGNLDVSGWVQCDNFRIDQTPSTGSATATFSGTNKPGGATTNQWMAINMNGTTKYIPVWG